MDQISYLPLKILLSWAHCFPKSFLICHDWCLMSTMLVSFFPLHRRAIFVLMLSVSWAQCQMDLKLTFSFKACSLLFFIFNSLTFISKKNSLTFLSSTLSFPILNEAASWIAHGWCYHVFSTDIILISQLNTLPFLCVLCLTVVIAMRSSHCWKYVVASVHTLHLQTNFTLQLLVKVESVGL
jgi:hypothetical protein